MKKTLLTIITIASAAIILTNCSKSNSSSSTPANKSTVTLTPASVNLDYNNNGNFYIHVTSAANWTATANQTWCNIAPATGANKDSIFVYCSTNSTSSSRSVVITVSASGENSGTCTINQATAASSMVCTGKQGNNTYFPLATGNQWVFGYNYYSGAPGLPTFTVGGTSVLNTVTYFKVTYNNGDGFTGPVTVYYRTATGTNNVYAYSSSGDQLIIPGTPMLNQSIGPDPIFGVADARTIVSLNATMATTTCNYTNCIKIEEFTNSTHLDYVYYVKGLGLIYNADFSLQSAVIN